MPRISTGTPKNLENSLLTTSSQWPSIGQAIGFAFRLLIKMKSAKANPPKAAAIKNKFKNVSISVFTTSLEPILSKIRNERKPRHRLAPLGNPKEKCSLQAGNALGQLYPVYYLQYAQIPRSANHRQAPSLKALEKSTCIIPLELSSVFSIEPSKFNKTNLFR